MYQVEEEPVETIHLYVVREGRIRPSIVPVIISLLTLSILVLVGTTLPYHESEQESSITVPAIPLPNKEFSSSVKITPTGIKTIPATTAQGLLTITNGSILSEVLPEGMILTGKDGREVITDAAVFVPAGSAAGYGVASVSAHAARSGKSGNIPTLDIDSVEGMALYIRNLHPFTGGADSYSVRFITAHDRENALSQARVILLRKTHSGLLSRPCLEHVVGTTSLLVAWTCQFVMYRVPPLPHVRVQRVQLIGSTVYLTITYIPRPQRLETK